MRLTERKVITALKQYGYKLTRQRQAVIRAITSSGDYLTPASIYQKAHQNYHNIGLVTIYHTLEILLELGLICELNARGISRGYIAGATEHHHHLICSNCGTVIDFTSHDFSKLEQSLSKESGFRVDSHLLEFFGLCQACQKAT